MHEHRERRRRPSERGIEEGRVGRVEDDAESERGTGDAQRQRHQSLARDQDEHDGRDRVAPAEEGGDRRSCVERHLPEHGLDGKGDARAEAKGDAETVWVTGDHEARLRSVQR